MRIAFRPSSSSAVIAACVVGTLFIGATGKARAQSVYLPFDDDDAGPGQIFVRDGGDQPTFVAGRHGRAILFGERAVVALPFEVDPRTYPQITVSAWIKFGDDAAGQPWLFNADGSYLPAMRLSNRRLAVRIGVGVAGVVKTEGVT